MIRPVTFSNKGQQLIGILHVPDGVKQGAKVPAVAMFHGFTGNKTEAHRLFVHVAKALCGSGFVVLRFDFRGSGDSDGEFDDMTVSGEVSDAEKALTFLSKHKWVDRENVGVLGLSMGGRVAAILASSDKRVKFAILYSAALGVLKDRFSSRISAENLEMLNAGEAIGVANGWYLKKPFFDSIDDPVPLEAMAEISVPVLLVHSDKDQTVPVEDSRRGFEIVRTLNPRNDLYIVKGGDHTFSERKHKEEVIEKTLGWLRTLGLGALNRFASAGAPLENWDYEKPWYHGSPSKLKALREGSTITQDRNLAEAFSHKPTLVSISEAGINHTGKARGFLYRISERLGPSDVHPHPRSSMEEGKEWLTTRKLKVGLIRESQIAEEEKLKEGEMEELRKIIETKRKAGSESK